MSAPCDNTEYACCVDASTVAECILVDGDTGKWFVTGCRTGCDIVDSKTVTCDATK